MSSKTIAAVIEPGTPVIELHRQEDEASNALPISSCKLKGQNSFAISTANIEFFNIATDLVAVEIKVTNDSGAFSAPDTLEILAAPFGAFVPWQPMAAVALPALAPGRSRYVLFFPPRAYPLRWPARATLFLIWAIAWPFENRNAHAVAHFPAAARSILPALITLFLSPFFCRSALPINSGRRSGTLAAGRRAMRKNRGADAPRSPTA